MLAGCIRKIATGLAGVLALCTAASAGPYILSEADTGKGILEQDAGQPPHPASVTKTMTTYLTFQAIREGRINKYTLLNISPFAASTPPSKSGFPVGKQITVDNALKLLMVKSANDMAVVLAEGVGGDYDRFIAEMNATAQRLGMTGTRFKNPHGLPDEEQVTTARDMAILAQAIIKEYPEHEMLFRIPSLIVGKRMLRNFNRLIDRYPGADGMKTGFICASGFNLVASAHRGDKRLIAVVFGSMNATRRAEEAAMLFERGFQSGAGLEILLGGSKPVVAVANLQQDPVNLYDTMCGPNRKKRRAAAMSDSGDEHDDDDDTIVETPEDALRALKRNRANLLVELPPSMKPIRVYLGPARDERGRPIRIAANGQEEVVAEEPKAKGNRNSAFAPFPDGFGPQDRPEKPLRLPRIAPMPMVRPANAS